MVVPRIPPLSELWDGYREKYLANLKPDCSLYEEFRKVFFAGARAGVDNLRLSTSDREKASQAYHWLQENPAELS